MVLAPVVRERKGEYGKLLEEMRGQGYARAVIDGELRRLDEEIALDKKFKHDISIVVDRLVMKEGLRKRLAESIEAASQLAEGLVEVEILDRKTGDEGAAEGPGAKVLSGPSAGKRGEVLLFSEKFACLNCGTSMPELEPRIFSFNSPHGCCQRCHGLGFQRVIDPELIVPDPTLSISEGALEPWTKAASIYHRRLLEAVAEANGIDTDVPWRDLPDAARELLLEGTGDDRHTISYRNRFGRQRKYTVRFDGHAAQPPAPLREHRLGEHPRAGRVADGAAAVPGLRRGAAAAGEPRGDGRRSERLRVHAVLGAAGAGVDRGARADRDRARDRAPGRARDRRAAAVPRLGRDRLPVAGARRRRRSRAARRSGSGWRPRSAPAWSASSTSSTSPRSASTSATTRS